MPPRSAPSSSRAATTSRRCRSRMHRDRSVGDGIVRFPALGALADAQREDRWRGSCATPAASTSSTPPVSRRSPWPRGELARRPVIVKIVGDAAWERGSRLGLTRDSFDRFQESDDRAGRGCEPCARLRNWSVRRATVVVAPSEHLAQSIRRWAPRRVRRCRTQRRACVIDRCRHRAAVTFGLGSPVRRTSRSGQARRSSRRSRRPGRVGVPRDRR